MQAGVLNGPETALIECPEFRQRLLALEASDRVRRDDERDEVLYVLDGSGTLAVGGEPHPLEPGTGVFVARGTAWRVEDAHELRVLSVLVNDPLPATASHAVIAAGERGTATAGREFTLLAHPEHGCESVTQFVGHIPPGRAPDHYHEYDEVIYVVEGEGTHWQAGETEHVAPGDVVLVPQGVLHATIPDGPGGMLLYCVFPVATLDGNVEEVDEPIRL